MKTITIVAMSVLLSGAFATATAANDMQVVTDAGRTVTVTALTNDILRVTNVGPGEASRPSGAVLPVSDPRLDVKSSRHGTLSILTTATGVVATLDPSGAVSINGGGARTLWDSGSRTISGGRREIDLITSGATHFYGAGERGYSFNLTGDTLVMYNKQNYGYTAGEPRIRQMNITMPLVVASSGYTLLFDDCAAAEMVMSNPIKYITESAAPVDYYFINGEGTLAGAVKATTALTGRQDLPPVWSLGYITSKYGYRTEAETRGVIDTLKTRHYPVDGVVLDLYWYGKEEDMGRLAWDPEQWPNHRGMLADLRDKGVNTVIISQPYVLSNGRGVDNFKTLRDAGLLLKDTVGEMLPVKIWVGEGGMFDVSNPATRDWLRQRYYELTKEGVGGWWGDLGEPEVHPDGGLHANGLTTRRYHNRYGNDWSSIIDELYTDSFPDTRLMTLMRGGTIGLQRHNVFPWSTDVSRSWGGLQPQVTIMLNSGLSGLGYMSHDVGGFAIDPEHPYDPELYMRWLQLGTFSPVLRTHAQRLAEPYHYPEQEETLRGYINERYRWLPYNYTLAWENAAKGEPLVRPLNYYSGDTRLDDINDEYLWGRNILVAPVLTPGTRERRVIFPEGSAWFDLNNITATPIAGGDTIVAPAPLEVLPMYVRAGSFVPTADYHMTNTGDFNTRDYTINYYPMAGVDDSYTLFEDDHTSTNSLQADGHAIITLSGACDADGSVAIMASSSGEFKGRQAVKNLTFKIYNMASKPAKVMNGRLKVSGHDIKYDPATRCVSINIKWNTARPLYLKVN